MNQPDAQQLLDNAELIASADAVQETLARLAKEIGADIKNITCWFRIAL